MIDRRLFLHMNWGLLALTLVISAIGIMNLYSASGIRIEDGISVASYYQRQIIWCGAGVLIMLICLCFNYRRLEALALPAYIVSVLLLLSVPVVGVVIMGARRWISFGLFNFQPSEMAKFTVLLMGAKFLSFNSDPLGWRRLVQTLFIGGIPAFLVMTQPDLGTALTILALVGGMIIFHGLIPRVLKTCLVLIPMTLPLAWFTLHDYQKLRILAFLDPASDPRGAGYQVLQAEIAIGSGSIWGKGFLQGTQHQLRFLPEKHTDFAIAVFGEEWGFIGCLVLLTLFCLFMLRIVDTVRDAKDRFGSTLVAGIFFYFCWQMLVNMGMVMGLMPVVGIPLPFISYGGSAAIVNFALIGLVLNVSMRRFMFKH